MSKEFFMSIPQPYFVSRYSYYPAKIYDPMKKDYPIFHASHLEIEGGITSKSLQCDFGESFSTSTVFLLSCTCLSCLWCYVIIYKSYSLRLNHRITRLVSLINYWFIILYFVNDQFYFSSYKFFSFLHPFVNFY